LIAQRLIQIIKTSYKSLDRPNFVSYSRGESDEAAYVEEYFRGKIWQDISFEKLRHDYSGPEQSCLCFMTSEAGSYYLPSFMLMSMDKEGKNHNIYPSALEFIGQNYVYLLESYSTDQLLTLMRYVEYMKLSELVEVENIGGDVGPYYAIAVEVLQKLPKPNIHKYPNWDYTIDG